MMVMSSLLFLFLPPSFVALSVSKAEPSAETRELRTKLMVAETRLSTLESMASRSASLSEVRVVLSYGVGVVRRESCSSAMCASGPLQSCCRSMARCNYDDVAKVHLG